jgi:hypothetical protein
MVVDVQPISGGSYYIIMIRSNIYVDQPCINLLIISATPGVTSLCNPTVSLRLIRLAFQSPPPFSIAPGGRLEPDDPRVLTQVSSGSRSPPCSRVRLPLELPLFTPDSISPD